MKDTNEKLYEIFKAVFYSPQYADLAARFREKCNAFISPDADFSDRQIQIVNEWAPLKTNF